MHSGVFHDSTVENQLVYKFTSKRKLSKASKQSARAWVTPTQQTEGWTLQLPAKCTLEYKYRSGMLRHEHDILYINILFLEYGAIKNVFCNEWTHADLHHQTQII